MIKSILNFRILRLSQVISRTGLSRSTIYHHISEKSFPKQVKLGAHAVGWIESEVNEWIASRITFSRMAT